MGRLKPITSIRDGYTKDDLDCIFCLYFSEETGFCTIDQCCCEQEKKAVGSRMRIRPAPKRKRKTEESACTSTPKTSNQPQPLASGS